MCVGVFMASALFLRNEAVTRYIAAAGLAYFSVRFLIFVALRLKARSSRRPSPTASAANPEAGREPLTADGQASPA